MKFTYSKKPFPSRINWKSFWKHRYLILNLINQIAYGTEAHAVKVINGYGGADAVGKDLYEASKEIIQIQP